MSPHRRPMKIAGLLILIGIIAGIFSVVPAIEASNYLTLVATEEIQVFSGAFFQFLMIPAYIGFAVCIYPLIRLSSNRLSLGFVGFRLISGTFHFIGVILLPLFLIVSQEFMRAGADATYLQTLGELLRISRDLVNHVAVILALTLGDLLLFVALYRGKFIPRVLAIWGFLASGLAMLASFLILFGLAQVISPLYLTMNMPLAFHSLIFAGWLILRGVDTTALSIAPSQQKLAVSQ